MSAKLILGLCSKNPQVLILTGAANDRTSANDKLKCLARTYRTQVSLFNILTFRLPRACQTIGHLSSEIEKPIPTL
jgi:hypothetical protein